MEDSYTGFVFDGSEMPFWSAFRNIAKMLNQWMKQEKFDHDHDVLQLTSYRVVGPKMYDLEYKISRGVRVKGKGYTPSMQSGRGYVIGEDSGPRGRKKASL